MTSKFLDRVRKNYVVLKSCSFKDDVVKKYSRAALVRDIDDTAFYVAYQYAHMRFPSFQYCGDNYDYAFEQYIGTIY